MIVLAIISLGLLAVLYLLALLMLIENGQTPEIEFVWSSRRKRDGTEEPVGKKIVSLKFRPLTDAEQRRRYAVFIGMTIPAMFFILIYLIQ